MHFKKACMEFVVSNVSEIKVLLQSWRQVLARVQEGDAIHERLTEQHLVNIALDDRPGPEEVVVLQLLAQPELLDRLIDKLKAQGWACSSQTLIPGLVTRCRLKKEGH